VHPYSSAYAVVRDPTEVLGRRIGAIVIDWAIVIAIFVSLGLAFAEQRDYPSASRAEVACDRVNEDTDEICIPFEDTAFVWTGGEVALILLLPIAFNFLADAVLTGITGFSIGKGLVGLRVIRQSDGRLCGIGRAMLRWLLWVADAAPYCLPIVGFAVGVSTKGHRRVGDMAAGTLVVDKADVGVVPVVPGLNAMAPPPWGPTAYGSPPPTWGTPTSPPPQTWGTPSAPPTPTWGAPTAPPAQPHPGWGPPPTSGPPPPASWGQPTAPPSWSQPAASPQPAPPQPAPPQPSPQQPWGQPTASVPTNPGVDSPLWDDARDTYIQWDPDLSAWVQWDEAAREWHPIV
jgi:hypothetical protein